MRAQEEAALEAENNAEQLAQVRAGCVDSWSLDRTRTSLKFQRHLNIRRHLGKAQEQSWSRSRPRTKSRNPHETTVAYLTIDGSLLHNAR